MKYTLVTWTAENPDGENFSGNATLEWEGESPKNEEIIANIQSSNPKLKGLKLSLQDKLDFNSREELDDYSLS